MSSFVKSYEFDYSNTNDNENTFFSDDEENDFNFKYFPKNQFKHIVKDVRRQRTKKEEERIWASFIQEQEESNYHLGSYYGNINAKQVLQDHFDEIDQEFNQELEDGEEDEEEDEVILEELSNKDEKEGQNTFRVDYEEKMTSSNSSPFEDENTGSSNSTIAVPEEYDAAKSKMSSSALKLDLKGKKLKKRYNSEVMSHRSEGQKHNFCEEINCIECRSSPNLISADDDEDGNYPRIRSTMEIRPHPIVAQKIFGIQSKIAELLDEILYRLSRIPKPDGDIDYNRRKQRVIEFANRFSRNYLYDLGRKMIEIDRCVETIAPDCQMQMSKRGILLQIQAIESKICGAYQLLYNALSAFCKHIPSSIIRGHPGKLKEVLQIVIDLADVCSKINLTIENFVPGDTGASPVGDETQKKSYAILSKLHSKINNEFLVQTAESSNDLPAYAEPVKRQKARADKAMLNRFSMYNIDSRMIRGSKSRQLFGKYHKNKVINGKLPLINPPPTPEKQQKQQQLAQLPQKMSKSSIKSRRIRRKEYQKEDDIKTMMDLMPMESESGSNTVIFPRKCQSSISTINKSMKARCCRKHRHSRASVKSSRFSLNREINLKTSPKNVKITNDQLPNLVPIIADIMTIIANKQISSEVKPKDAFAEIIKEYVDKNKDKHQITEEIMKIADVNVKTFEGSKDHTSSISEKFSEINRHQIEVTCDVHQYVESENGNLTHLILSEELVDRVIKYRDEFQKDCEFDPMYKSNSPNKPWEVVAWIADNLVDELIVEICKELEMNDVIQKLYDLEFQEF